MLSMRALKRPQRMRQLIMLNPARLLALTALLITGLTGAAQAANCLSDGRNFATRQNSLRLQDYRCRTGSGAEVRVQFHRVSDIVAAAMLEGRLPAIFGRILGRPYYLDNPVHREFISLMRSYGVVHKYLNCEEYLVASSAGGSITQSNRCETKNPQQRTMGGWNADGETGIIAVPSDMRSLIQGRIPPAYREVRKRQAHDSRQIWRSVTAEDLRDYPRKVAEFNRMMTGLREYGGADKQSPYMALMAHVGRAGLPPDFLIINAAYRPEEGCEGFVGWKMHVIERAVVVDFAMIENVSRSNVEITGLFGVSSANTGLRKAGLSRLLAREVPRDLGMTGAVLRPGERAVVLQKLTFVVPPKNRGRFSAPLPDYVYGPEISLKGFRLNGEKIDLNSGSEIYLGLTASSEGGSCPFVYAWSDKEGAFVNHGKILHKANGRDKEQSDSMSFDGFVSRFRIAEEEMEIAHLDEVTLTVHLRQGGTRLLRPAMQALKAADAKRVSLPLGREIALSFHLPDGLKPEDVSRSVLTARGYYERYSALPFSQAALRMNLKSMLSGFK